MEYKGTMHVVVETPTYLKAAAGLFSEAEMAEIVTMIEANPDYGDVMQGTGGFRKVRVGRDGMGKRGGARVVYILRNELFPVFLITAYAKSAKENLSKAERNSLRSLAEEIFKSYGEGR